VFPIIISLNVFDVKNFWRLATVYLWEIVRRIMGFLDKLKGKASKTVKESVDETVNKATDLGKEGFAKAKDVASEGIDKAKDTAHEGIDKAKSD
jgi:hypothetical protein